MTNVLAVVVYCILTVVIAITIFVACIRDRHKSVTKYLIRLCIIAIGWQICAMLHFLVHDEAFSLWVFDAKLVFVAFAPVQLLMLSVRFYSSKSSRRTTVAFGILCVIPIITVVLAVTSPLHGLIRAEIFFEQFQPLRILRNVRGLWFWVHSGYSYVIMVASIIVILFNHAKLPRGFRIPSFLVALGSGIALFSNIFVVFTPYSEHIDLTLVGLSIAIVFTYAGIAISDESSILIQAFDNIFTYLEDYIFILNNRRSVIEMNPAARQWLHALNINLENMSFDALLDKLRRFTNETMPCVEPLEQDFHLVLDQQISHYSLNERPINDHSGRLLGTFAIFTDITRYKLLIERIEQSAGIDPLTNLGNRRGYEQALENLDKPSSLPFSVILGDVNELKAVNDSKGHAAGDTLLRVIAQILCDACPEGAHAYRIGGDEFVMLLPFTGAETAEEVVAAIRAAAAQKNAETSSHDVSIALGVATKETEDQDLIKCIAQADSNMYQNKLNDRRAKRGQGGSGARFS